MKNTVRTFLIAAFAFGIPAFLFAAPRGDANPDQAPVPGTPSMVDQGAMPGPGICPQGMKGAGQHSMKPGKGNDGAMGGMRGMQMRGMRPGEGRGEGCIIPDAFKTRMNDLRAQTDAISQQWAEAVAARGTKSIEDLKAEFVKTNADALAKLKADNQRLNEDLKAIREGLDLPRAGRMWAGNHPGRPEMGMEDGMAPDALRDTINTEIAAALNAQKGQITPATLEQIRKDVFAKHSEEFSKAMRQFRGNAMMPPPPQMTPELARMREAMCDLRKLSIRDRRQFRAGIRQAMQIEDPTAREAAIDKLVSELHENTESDDSGED
ncbi:MAG: hypothetical protein WC360_07090 [Opitutales bacterium]|jgi:hypothetical protein